MGEVIAFRDPDATLEGAELEAVLPALRAAAPDIVTDAMSQALHELCRVPGCRKIGLETLCEVLAAEVRSQFESRGF